MPRCSGVNNLCVNQLCIFHSTIGWHTIKHLVLGRMSSVFSSKSFSGYMHGYKQCSRCALEAYCDHKWSLVHHRQPTAPWSYHHTALLKCRELARLLDLFRKEFTTHHLAPGPYPPHKQTYLWLAPPDSQPPPTPDRHVRPSDPKHWWFLPL